MQNLLLILNASPYGNERALSSLRLGLALLNAEPRPELKLFLLSDGVVTALAGQSGTNGVSLGEMVGELLAAGAELRVCRTCMVARGISESQLIPGVRIGTMPELAAWTLAADKVISF